MSCQFYFIVDEQSVFNMLKIYQVEGSIDDCIDCHGELIEKAYYIQSIEEEKKNEQQDVVDKIYNDGKVDSNNWKSPYLQQKQQHNILATGCLPDLLSEQRAHFTTLPLKQCKNSLLHNLVMAQAQVFDRAMQIDWSSFWGGYQNMLQAEDNQQENTAYELQQQ